MSDMKSIRFPAPVADEMVRAILEGRKTVTRRVVKFLDGRNPNWTGYVPDGPVLYGSNNIPAAKSPYRPGDILYVRETWRPFSAWSRSNSGCEIEYKAGGIQRFDDVIALPTKKGEWHPSIHMPKEAARLFLWVTGVRVERLQEITEEQARAEGALPVIVTTDVDKPESEQEWHEWLPALPGFIRLWDSTIKKADLPRYGWAANPWVWVIAFERISREGALKDES